MTTVQVFLGSGSMSLNKAYADIELRAQTEMTPKDIADAVVLEYRLYPESYYFCVHVFSPLF